MSDKTPEARALEAAEAIAAEGSPVTARAVQQRAKVNMNVASPVARDWNEQQAQAREVPPMPDAVTLRVEALWRAAFEAARDEHQVETDGWAARLKAAQDERDGALEDLSIAQQEVEAANQRTEDASARIAELEAEPNQARGEAAAAETRAVAAEGIATGLKEALAVLTPGATADQASKGPKSASPKS